MNTKTFILPLAQHEPKSFISGRAISLDKVLKEYNRNEFHHVAPKSFLAEQGESIVDDSVLANRCFMSRTDNNQLGSVSPAVYRAKMQANAIQRILD